MTTPSFIEDHISQIPALKLLMNMGWKYLSPDEALESRGGRSSNVLLEDILKRQLEKINKIDYKQKEFAFSESNINNAILAIRDLPVQDGFLAANKAYYELITLGKSFDQTVLGDKKSFSFQYIDWKRPDNNVYHITEEYSVLRSDRADHYRPDIVLFINGIPMVIIECKSPKIKEPVEKAIEQHLRNQQEDSIRSLYLYSNLTLALATHQAKYGTTATSKEFWGVWKEMFRTKEDERLWENEISVLKHKALPDNERTVLFKERFKKVWQYFENIEQKEQVVTIQDKLLFSFCNPKRLLEIIYDFILYDDGIKKIARYQQYFAIKNTLTKILKTDAKGNHEGGVIWHTQGSGKSLTMVMLAQLIASHPKIKNPKIILVTDRIDLDDQITETFKKCHVSVVNADKGASKEIAKKLRGEILDDNELEKLKKDTSLLKLIAESGDAVITTLIHKFEAAVNASPQSFNSSEIYILIDEGHRTQHGTFNINMQKTMPNACYIAFTGTPLFKKDKSTMQRFGTMIDQYTVRQAVDDGAVLPLVYEGRFTEQEVNKEVIDNYFQMVSEDLSEYERADLKKKFSQRSHIADADQNIYSIAWDITNHYIKNFQGTGLKGQMVCSSKRTAVKYFDYMKQIGKVSVALIISPPDDREGEDSAYTGSSDNVKKFWSAMMDQYGNSVRYEENIISQFKNEEHPEIIIVVDKLLTGFDAPRNTVLYLTRKLRGHTLLQAIARVNRLYPDKDYGYIIDYAGIVEELDDALITYSDMEEFDEKDLEGTLVSVMEEIEKLDPAHQELLNIFKQISNKEDIELYQQTLREKDIRDDFYKRLATYARILKLALSSIDFHKNTSESKINTYKSDLKFFMNLRTAVAQRFSDKVDYKVYEGQIQKLIDQHITTQGIQPLTELVNIFDEEAFQKEVENTIGEAAKADKIASRTSKHISERMDEDPVFYRKFSQMIQQAINDFYNERISELEYLKKVKEYRDKVLTRTDSEIPEKIRHNPTASAYYGIVHSFYKDKGVSTSKHEELFADASLQIEEIISARKVVNWHNNQDVLKKMVLNIGVYIYDEIGAELGLKVSFSEIDKIAESIVKTAKARSL